MNNNEKRVIILGALSAIAEATARLYAAEGARLLLAGRQAERLERVAEDLRVRGAAECIIWPIDLADVQDARREFTGMVAALGGQVDSVLVFYGLLGDVRSTERDLELAQNILRTNLVSTADWCLLTAELLERQNSGVLLAVSSVAGDRGRQSNYIYGAAKAGLNALVQGLAHRLAGTHSRAVVVKLGYVDTPMTAHMKRNLLFAEPCAVARRIKTIAERSTASVVYVPFFWRWIMLIVRNIPDAILHRTKL